jgi:hypothetical protein
VSTDVSEEHIARNKFSKKPASKQVASRIIRQLEIQVYIANER